MRINRTYELIGFCFVLPTWKFDHVLRKLFILIVLPFLFLRRTSGGSGDPPSGTANRQVSLANIATAFLSERKFSPRRQSSTRRKKRLTTKSVQGSTSSRHSSYATTTDDILAQRPSIDDTQNGTATLFVPTVVTTNAENKHRSTTVRIGKVKECHSRRY